MRLSGRPDGSHLRLFPMTLREALLRRHHLEIQRRLFSRARHGTVLEMKGWRILAWDYDGWRGQVIVPITEAPDLSLIAQFPASAAVETFDPASTIGKALTQQGWVPAKVRTGYWYPYALLPCLGDYPPVYQVRPDDGAGSFAEVVSSFWDRNGVPKGATGQFFARPESLVGADVIAGVMDNGVTTAIGAASVMEWGGIVSWEWLVVREAWRHQHYAIPLLRWSLEAAHRAWGVDGIYACHLPADERFPPVGKLDGVEPVTSLTCWRHP